MNDKIKITWDDVRSSQVDEKLRQREAATRADAHYQQHAGAMPVASSSFFYNTIVYMAVFGFVGGLVAWVLGEMVFAIIPDSFEKFQYVAVERGRLIDQANQGEIPREEAERKIEQLLQDNASNPYVEIAFDPLTTEQQKIDQIQQQQTKDGPKAMISALFWFGTFGICLGFFLSIADHAVSRNWRGVVINGSIGIVLGFVGAEVFGVGVGFLYAALGGGGTESMAKQVIARTLAWGLFGGCLALAPGLVLRNTKRLLIGLAGGLIGGTLGGLLFDVIARTTDSAVASRFFALLAIGMVTGIGTGIIETAAKDGWLRVIAGLIAGKQFVLYKNPTYIGSSPQCEIYLFKDPAISPRHAAIHKVHSGYDLEDLRSSTQSLVNGRPVSRARLKNGDQVQIGGTTFLFQERTRS